MLFNENDQRLWNAHFAVIPPAEKEAPPTAPMKDCLAYFKANNGSHVLDAGCGNGTWAIYLARHGLSVKGFDFSENAVRFAEEWAYDLGLDIDFEVSPLTAPSFPGQVFDAVLAARVLDNLSRREMFMAIDALSGKLRRGGLLYVLFGAYLSEAELAERRAADPMRETTYTLYKDSELKASFPGFRLVERRSYPEGLRGFFLKKS